MTKDIIKAKFGRFTDADALIGYMNESHLHGIKKEDIAKEFIKSKNLESFVDSVSVITYLKTGNLI